MPPQGYEGFAALGDVLTGGAGRRAEANYPKYLGEAADGYSALEKAAIVRAQRLARDNLPAAIAADPVLGQRAALNSAMLGMATGQPNLNTQAEGLQGLGDIETDRLITEALARGDTKAAQQLSAVKTDKVLPELGAGGKAVFTPIGGEVALTPLGDADVMATEALRTQRLASAGAADARAVKSLLPPAPRVSPIQRRAATANEDLAIIKAEIGRDLTAVERADYLQGKPIKLGSVSSPLGSPAETSSSAITTPDAYSLPKADFSNVRGSSESVAAAVGRGPKVGTVMDGYRYMGGDPANPKSWAKL